MVVSAAASEPVKPGKCWLVGAGPGPADYLTMKAVKLLQTADVVVYDDLGSQDALGFVPPGAELVYVGKRGGRESIKQAQIDQLLVERCAEGRNVVRLKGGCPAVFSRLASEVSALRAGGIPYELVPGVSSALAAPLFAGFPLTHVSLSPSFTVLSGHDPDTTDWGALAGLPTLVLLMGGRNLPTIVTRLRDTGWPADTPVAVVRDAGLPEQRVWHSRLDTVEADTADAGSLSPCVMIIGRVAESGLLT
ncbi:hypothetical protein PLESTB_001549600 [Pleodorina starrii]|uniref:uroporphyrinogen-III C-methyltransferase n=1 Tax=Pleodorina starrii TaxID=330485 RepID=A0A9W6F813_9CHLO|nr:hypothetical protein PLESTM_001902200 [Pleodorina starrii]GLC59892.1 hypothetical protein PLESTB_001549600 [Pleodorina starrii]